MKIIGIANTKCTCCESCVKDCPEGLFRADHQKAMILFEDPLDCCITCGHCIAVCPTDAVFYEALEKPLEAQLIAHPEKIVGTEDLAVLLRARRSMRHFENREISSGMIEYILNAMRFSPTGSNKQAIHYTVITDRKKIAHFSNSVINSFRAIRIVLSFLRLIFPFRRGRKGSFLSNAVWRSVSNRVKQAKAGEDPIFFHAPCVIVLSAPTYGHQSPVDAGIALAHGMLAAQAQGLGTCLIGFAHEKLRLSPSLRRFLKMPSGHKAQGVIALGFPAVRYVRAPMRKPISVTRI